MKKHAKTAENGANVNSVNKLKVLLFTAQMQTGRGLECCCEQCEQYYKDFCRF